MIRTIVQRSMSSTFRRSFAIILLAQAVMIAVAWLLLGINTDRWIRGKVAQAISVSQQVASSADWSAVATIPRNTDSALGERYLSKLTKISRRYFIRDEGAVYLAVADQGEEYDILPSDVNPMDDMGKADPPILRAYATRALAFTPVPLSTDNGTYLAAYTPILKDGKVVGVVAAEYDTAPLQDFTSIVRSAFWLSVIPAIVVSLIVAYVFATMFVEPMDVFRKIQKTAQAQRTLSQAGQEDELWGRLTAKEKEVAELARQGRTGKEIADALSVAPETVKQHLKNIREKTGWSKVDLAVQAQARRTAALAMAP